MATGRKRQDLDVSIGKLNEPPPPVGEPQVTFLAPVSLRRRSRINFLSLAGELAAIPGGPRRADPRADRAGDPDGLPGVHAVHAVDAAGVHPLLLAIGSERYVPYARATRAAGAADPGQRHPRPGAAVAGQVPVDRRPAKTTRSSTSTTSPAFFRHLLARVDLARDLHFQTRTTIDTLDYSRRRPQRGIEAGDRRRRPAAPRAAARAARRACPCRRASPTRGSPCRACWRSGPRRIADGPATRRPIWPLLRRSRPGRPASMPSRWWCWSTTASSPPAASTTSCG